MDNIQLAKKNAEALKDISKRLTACNTKMLIGNERIILKRVATEYIKSAERLSEYENTGLTPQDVEQLKVYDEIRKLMMFDNPKKMQEYCVHIQFIADKLKAENAELKELLRLAKEDMKHNDNCDVCSFKDCQPNCNCDCDECTLYCVCRDCRDENKWQWQHADRLNELFPDWK